MNPVFLQVQNNILLTQLAMQNGGSLVGAPLWFLYGYAGIIVWCVLLCIVMLYDCFGDYSDATGKLFYAHRYLLPWNWFGRRRKWRYNWW